MLYQFPGIREFLFCEVPLFEWISCERMHLLFGQRERLSKR
jgi:hypothetical protein